MHRLWLIALAATVACRDAGPMVDTQLLGRDIRNPAVLEAMRRVPRHEFVPEDLRHRAYEDGPLPIGDGQTISQPDIVAYMTQAIEPGEDGSCAGSETAASRTPEVGPGTSGNEHYVDSRPH